MASVHEARVLNLLRRVDMATVSPKRWGVIKLLTAFPSARNIRYGGKCHCRRGNQLSFQLPQMDMNLHDFKGEARENCGWYCPHCGFGNAGAREIWRRKHGAQRRA